MTAPLTEIRCDACGRNLLQIIFESAEPVLRLPGTVEGMLDMIIGMMTMEVLRAIIQESDKFTKKEKRELLETLDPGPVTLTMLGHVRREMVDRRKEKLGKGK
jgi:hypothetical protein